jgi:hypothetical protein
MKALLLITAAYLAVAVLGQLDTGAPPHARDTQSMRLSQPYSNAAGPTLPLFPLSTSKMGKTNVQGAGSKTSDIRFPDTAEKLLALFPETPIICDHQMEAESNRLSENARDGSEAAGTLLPLFPETPINYNDQIEAEQICLSRTVRNDALSEPGQSTERLSKPAETLVPLFPGAPINSDQQMNAKHLLENAQRSPSTRPVPISERPSEASGTRLPLFSVTPTFSRPGSQGIDEKPNPRQTFGYPKRTLNFASFPGHHPESCAYLVFGPSEDFLAAAGPSEAVRVLNGESSHQQVRGQLKRKRGYWGKCLPDYCERCDRSFLVCS